MMHTTLIDELRDPYVVKSSEKSLSDLCLEAADEIERLRAALEDTAYPLGEINELISERDRLRAALKLARGAIASLSWDALGVDLPDHPEDRGYSFRDAILSDIDAALGRTENEQGGSA